MTTAPSKRLIVVSNRLPYALEKGPRGTWSLKPGSGGLVTALVPVLRDRGGVWIGWTGASEQSTRLAKAFREASPKAGYTLDPVSLSKNDVELYYHGYSNESVWPLFHDLQCNCQFDPDYWRAYVKVNRKFAQAVADAADGDDFIWVHDYQLMDVAHHLRETHGSADLAFFLHIPFPSPDIFMSLPERQAVLTSLLAYDLLGFQTERDRRNFVQCVRVLMKHTRVRAEGHVHSVQLDDHEVRVASFPIGIDARSMAEAAESAEVTEFVQGMKSRFADRQVVFGLDRLDYTKGIPQRLRAFANLMERFPELRKRVHLLQVVVPSREGIPSYDELRVEIERLIGHINGRYSEPGWVPIHYLYRSLDKTELLAFYRAADIALVTPLKDGMNLVAKEFCACSLEEDSVLVLSQFAGAAAQLGKAALVVNPHDVEQTADAIYKAFQMPAGERRYRMRRLRQNVRRQDIFWWVDSFMRAASGKELRDFPVQGQYIPEHYEHHGGF